ncbi:MAG: hypothetical protein JXR53_00430 [Bacteroidales bacterium]|nr:hypothetical protein [Bacteroidales bacterium]
MNFRFLLFVSLIVIAFSACKKEEKRDLLTERIEYDVTIDNEDTMEPWMNNVSPSDRMSFLEFLFQQLEAGKAVDSMGVKVDEASIKNMLMALDSNLQFGEAKLFEYVRNEQIEVQLLRFREKWTYNPETFCIYKQVDAVAPGIVLRDSTDFIYKVIPLFWVNCDTSAIDHSRVLTSLIISDALVQNTTMPVVELYGESPYYLNNIDEPLRNKFFMDLKEEVIMHNISAYDYFFKDMSVSDVENFRDHTDSIHVPDENGNLVAFEVENKILPKEFTRLKFVEKWEYSTEPFVFQKTVMGINPSLYVEDEYGTFQGYRPMFWVVFNDEDLEYIRSKVNVL